LIFCFPIGPCGHIAGLVSGNRGINQIAAQPRNRDRVRSSSATASRLLPTTSAAKIAAILRVPPMAHPLGVTQSSTKASP
jgi:hypothetical protein